MKLKYKKRKKEKDDAFKSTGSVQTYYLLLS